MYRRLEKINAMSDGDITMECSELGENQTFKISAASVTKIVCFPVAFGYKAMNNEQSLDITLRSRIHMI